MNLAVYVQQRNIEKVHWAMRSLKQAMKWDEDTFGLEYDLSEFNIVAVSCAALLPLVCDSTPHSAPACNSGVTFTKTVTSPPHVSTFFLCATQVDE